jgi:hypothetical protein
MNKLRNLLVAALLTLPVVGLNASALDSGVEGTELRPVQQYGCCYVLIMGRWYCIPC